MDDAMAEPTGDTSVIKDHPGAVLVQDDATGPGLDAGPITRAFMRVNVYIYSKPPKKGRSRSARAR